VILIILPLVGLVYLVVYLRLKQENDRAIGEKKELISRTTDLSSRTYSESRIKGLPGPVQRYFRYALKEGQPDTTSVYLRHDGQIKTALHREWTNIEGEGFYSTEEPGFIWRARTALLTIREMYISGGDKTQVRLLGLFPMGGEKGLRFYQGGLVRWLGESLLFPTNLLPGDRLRWFPVDDTTALLSLEYKNHSVHCLVRFNSKGEIISLKTKRFRGKDGRGTWIVRVSRYEVVNGMKIPMRIEGSWLLGKEEHSYTRFNIRTIHHR